MCAAVGQVSPVQQRQAWTPPKDAASPVELASSAAGWASVPGAARPMRTDQLEKAKKEVRRAAWIFAIVGGISVALGLVAEFADIAWLQAIGNWYTVAEGAVFLLLALFVSRGSVVAAGIGAGLYVLDTIALAFAGYFSIIRILIIIALVRAVLSANALRKERRQAASQPAAAAPPDQSRAA